MSNVEVFLQSAVGKRYKLKIFSINNTFIKCGIPGGLPGQYRVRINFTNGTGDAIATGADIFTYFFRIDSVSTNEGSVFGNTLLTIEG